MPAIITSKFRFHNAEQFKESFSETAATNYYLFIGRPGEFASSGTTPETLTGGSDAAPPSPADNRSSEAFHWDDMLAAKRIQSTGVTHAIPRRDLDISGSTTYDMYKPDYSASKTATSGANTLFDSTFYFVTSAYRVYKVLDNNGGTAITGGTEPTSTDAAPFTIGGYTLKYMYTLSTTDVQNFLTPDFMPAPTAAESGNALADGRLDIVNITNAGVAASWTTTADRVVTNVPIRGDGTGGLCSVTIGGTSGANDGQITAVAVTANGTGYTHAKLDNSDIIHQHNIQFTGEATNPSMTVLNNAGFSTQPVFDVIIGPDGGHGSNPAKELGGHFALMDVKLTQTESFDFSVVNDFRQVGIVRNPYSYGTSSVFSNSTARQTFAVKLASNSGTFQVDEKISQSIPAVALQNGTAGISVSSSTITINTQSAHKLVTGQIVEVTGGNFSGANNKTGHQGRHYITKVDDDSFSYVVTSSRTPTGDITGSVSYTVVSPQAVVVEYDATNNILFYIQTKYTDQGTGSTGEKIPFSDDHTITGAVSNATGVPKTDQNAAINNTAFTGGYANPEMQPDSGDVIYIENRKPISRASDQTEDIKLIVEF